MIGIVQEIRGKIKSFLQDQAMFTSVLLVLVAVASFGLGRQSVVEKAVAIPNSSETAAENSPAKVLKTPEVTKESNLESRYVASKNGQVFHLLTCPGAKRISDANKIYFNTKEEALAAGLRPAANCEGI